LPKKEEKDIVYGDAARAIAACMEALKLKKIE
jgi:hypothetical protein